MVMSEEELENEPKLPRRIVRNLLEKMNGLGVVV
jgi:hypothetical protein